MDRIVGTCSNCGGRVTIPNIWMGMDPPIPTCRSCGATEKQPHGPVVETENPTRKVRQKPNDLTCLVDGAESPGTGWPSVENLKDEDGEIERYEAACKGAR